MSELAAREGPLAQLHQARDLLEASHDLAEVKSIRDVAMAAQEYARAKQLGQEAERYAAEITVRAERRIGQLLPPPAVPAASRGVSTDAVDTPRKQIGYKLSARSQQLARFSDEEFERRVTDPKAKPSADSLLRVQRNRVTEQRRAEQARREAELAGTPVHARVEHGDFRQVLAGLSGIDAVITDPPYGAAFLPLLADLAKWADEVLAEDGVLVVLVGQTHLPEVFRLLEGGRPYRWTACYFTPGAGFTSMPRRVQSNWKPLLVYGGGPRFGDVIRSEGDIFAHTTTRGGSGTAKLAASDKASHIWGQDLAGFGVIAERLTLPGQTVADPLCGGGTTLLAAYALGRHVIGADIDAESVRTARERLGIHA